MTVKQASEKLNKEFNEIICKLGLDVLKDEISANKAILNELESIRRELSNIAATYDKILTIHEKRLDYIEKSTEKNSYN